MQGQPDVYEEAFNALDFQFRQRFADDWRWTLRLRNLLDPKVSYTQGGLSTRAYHKGREFLLSEQRTAKNPFGQQRTHRKIPRLE